jgi:type III protein arginine methyltransferase
VLAKLSGDLVVGAGGDIPRKADMLISEILDSALLGEGVLPFLRHALTHLVVPNAIVVPQSAVVYAQLIDCPCIAATHELPIMDFTLFRSPRASRCAGARPLLPVHVSALKDAPVPMSPEVALFAFDFSVPSERRINKRVCDVLA